jgi:hypothetical protein
LNPIITRGGKTKKKKKKGEGGEEEGWHNRVHACNPSTREGKPGKS